MNSYLVFCPLTWIFSQVSNDIIIMSDIFRLQHINLRWRITLTDRQNLTKYSYIMEGRIRSPEWISGHVQIPLFQCKIIKSGHVQIQIFQSKIMRSGLVQIQLFPCEINKSGHVQIETFVKGIWISGHV